MGIFSKIVSGLKKTKDTISYKLARLFNRTEINNDFFDELEEILLSSDVGAFASVQIVETLRERVDEELVRDVETVKQMIRDIMISLIDKKEEEEKFPLVIMIVGVNGVGKTTTIGKLANYYLQKNKSVVVAAADTFRAAASDQLSIWAERAGVRVIKHTEGADPSAVVYDAIHSTNAKQTDVLIIDTAGRLHNKANLMEELKKMQRVLTRECNHDNIKKYIVLDATTGQNAIPQVKYFDETVGIDGIILTKLDGTAKGGVVFALQSGEVDVPVKFIGVGEKIEDLEEFNTTEFVNAIVE